MASPSNFQLPVLPPPEVPTVHVADAERSFRVTFTASAPPMALSPTSISMALKSPEGIDCHGNERQVLGEQAKFFNNPLLSDVILVVGGERFYAHKLVLVRSSDVFERMFSSEWSDSKTKVTTVLYIMCVMRNI